MDYLAMSRLEDEVMAGLRQVGLVNRRKGSLVAGDMGYGECADIVAGEGWR